MDLGQRGKVVAGGPICWHVRHLLRDHRLTRAAFLRVNLLNKADLPTLGRPMIATCQVNCHLLRYYEVDLLC